MNWQEYFMRLVYTVSYKSKDIRTKIGAVITDKENGILSTGFNGICRLVADPMDDPSFFNLHQHKNRYKKPLKYYFFEHAERNACYHAARNGIRLKDSTLYTQGVPCCDCARACIQSGIRKIVVHGQWPLNGISKLDGSQDWLKSLEYSRDMLGEAMIPIELFSMKLEMIGYADGKIINV